jgi:8-oxo-dGTP pyrophosphatase MutT (NUDIX family)
MSKLYHDLKNKFQYSNCQHKTIKDFDFQKFPHCKFKEFDKVKKCAVLLLLFKSKFINNNELCVLLTIRSSNLKSFPGEICFPGGKFDSELDATYIDTALREASEEIGLNKEGVRVLCQLCPCLSPFGHYIVPIVGLLENTNVTDSWDILKNLKASPDEVAFIFWLPLTYVSEALKSNELFNQHISPLDLSKLNLENHKNKIPEYVIRNIFEINEEYLKNDLNKLDVITPINTFIYGINSQLAIFLCLVCIEGSEFECKIKGKIDNKNILTYLHYTTSASYLLFKINNVERMIRMNKKSKL